MTTPRIIHTLVAATGNRGKLAEITALLEGLGIEIKTPADFPGAPDPEETGSTYSENALIKARALRYHTGLPALADDSGLEVDFLGGAPGVISARYAGPEQDAAKNRIKLLGAMSGVPQERRGARFVCVLALAVPGRGEHLFDGECRGVIAAAERGSGGFGYDPVFFVPNLGMTMAEMAPAVKNGISHRYRALSKLRAALESGLF
jgi:XTP/dITP diphosphohydrolase